MSSKQTTKTTAKPFHVLVMQVRVGDHVYVEDPRTGETRFHKLLGIDPCYGGEIRFDFDGFVTYHYGDATIGIA